MSSAPKVQVCHPFVFFFNIKWIRLKMFSLLLKGLQMFPLPLIGPLPPADPQVCHPFLPYCYAAAFNVRETQRLVASGMHPAGPGSLAKHTRGGKLDPISATLTDAPELH